MAEQQNNRRVTSDEPSWLHTVRDLVTHVLDVDPDAATFYLVAVTEIVVNAEQVHRDLCIVRPAIAEIDVDRRQITVTDHGGGFEMGDAEQPPAPEETSGRGLHLARAFCPGLSAVRTSDGMQFTLPFPQR